MEADNPRLGAEVSVRGGGGQDVSELNGMRRWVEVLLVVVLVALAARFFVPDTATTTSPSPTSPPSYDPYGLGGYDIVGAKPPWSRAGEGISGFDGPKGRHIWGKELSSNDKVTLWTGLPRDQVTKVLGKPVGYNSDNSQWGYWTRGLPNQKMGILITFNKQNENEQIDLASDWSTLATQMALRSIPKKR